jgi:hypothetical protein
MKRLEAIDGVKNVIRIGDRVAWRPTASWSHNFQTGIVDGFTPKKVRVLGETELQNGERKVYEHSHNVDDKQLIKIPMEPTS